MPKISKTIVDKHLRDMVFSWLIEENANCGENFTKINDRQYGVLLTDDNNVERYVRIGAIVAEEREDMTAAELMQSEIDKYNESVSKKQEKEAEKKKKIAEDKKKREERKMTLTIEREIDTPAISEAVARYYIDRGIDLDQESILRYIIDQVTETSEETEAFLNAMYNDTASMQSVLDEFEELFVDYVTDEVRDAFRRL